MEEKFQISTALASATVFYHLLGSPPNCSASKHCFNLFFTKPIEQAKSEFSVFPEIIRPVSDGVGDGSQISTNQKPESTVFSLVIG